MKDVVLFDELKAPVASADASPVDDSADDDDDDIDVDDNFLSMNGDRTSREVSFWETGNKYSLIIIRDI